MLYYLGRGSSPNLNTVTIRQSEQYDISTSDFAAASNSFISSEARVTFILPTDVSWRRFIWLLAAEINPYIEGVRSSSNLKQHLTLGPGQGWLWWDLYVELHKISINHLRNWQCIRGLFCGRGSMYPVDLAPFPELWFTWCWDMAIGFPHPWDHIQEVHIFQDQLFLLWDRWVFSWFIVFRRNIHTDV